MRPRAGEVRTNASVRSVPPTRARIARRLAVAWFCLSTALLVWPIYPWIGNHVHPRVLGLPWSLVWVLGVIALNFGVLVWLYLARVVDEREPDDVDPASGAPS